MQGRLRFSRSRLDDHEECAILAAPRNVLKFRKMEAAVGRQWTGEDLAARDRRRGGRRAERAHDGQDDATWDDDRMGDVDGDDARYDD